MRFAVFSLLSLILQSVSAYGAETLVMIGPSLIHVKKPNSIDYKLWTFTARTGEEKPWTYSCLFSESDDSAPTIEACLERGKNNKVKMTTAVPDPAAPRTDNEIVEAGMKCRYDTANPMVVTVSTSPETSDEVCATPKICTDGHGNEEVSHVSCPARPQKVKLKGREGEFSVCPRLRGCETEKFITKNVGRKTSIASEVRNSSTSSTPVASSTVASPTALPSRSVAPATIPATVTKPKSGRGAHK